MKNANRASKARGSAVPPANEPSQWNPTDVPDGEWLYAQRRRGAYPKETDRGGKWLIFVPIDRVDKAWKSIRTAVEEGSLGGRARVSTGRRPNPSARDPNARVIAVYTYDWRDEKDVMRVREQLRRLGFKEPLHYKTDSDTQAGRYSDTDGDSVNKYTA